MHDPYLYPGTELLKNKLNIRDEQQINEMEAAYTSTRLREMLEFPIEGIFGFEHLCKMHHYIFQDIFDWAGQTRIINIEKSEQILGGISIEYAESQDIKTLIESVLSKMKSEDWEGMKLDQKAEAFSKHLSALWKVHPFREGNTRTIVTFCSQFAESKGIILDTDLFQKNSVYMRNALVAASAVFLDLGDKSKPEYLVKIVKDSLERGSEMKRKPLDMLLQDARSDQKKQEPSMKKLEREVPSRDVVK